MSSTGLENNPLVSLIITTYNRKGEVIECIDSVFNSSYNRIEVVVVDNASQDGTDEALENRYHDKIKLIKSEKNLYGGGGRNLGTKYALGEYLLFIDSDNVIDREMVENMVKSLQDNKDLHIGMCGPFTYYKSEPRKLCWINNSMDLITSITLFSGTGVIDNGQFEKVDFIKVHHIPNVFMIRKDIFRSVGGVDQDYVMHYEESDLAEKIRRAGYGIVLFPKAKTWHDVPLGVQKGHKSFKGENPSMVYYVTRNRIYFMRKNSGGIRLFLFLSVFSNVFLIYNLLILLFNRQFNLFKLALKGYWDGTFTPLIRR